MGHLKRRGISALAALLLCLPALHAAQAEAAVFGAQVQVVPDASMITVDDVFTNRVVWRSPLLDVRHLVGGQPQDNVLTDGDVFQVQVIFTPPLAVELSDAPSNSLEGVKFEIFGSAPSPDPTATVDYLWLFGGVRGGPLALSGGQPVMTNPVVGNFGTLGLPTRIISRNLDLVTATDSVGVVTFESILLTLTYHGPGAWTFDRARFTVASEQVAIVPEPSAALLMIVLLAAAGRQPRRGSGPASVSRGR